jgi:hypothetical protein
MVERTTDRQALILKAHAESRLTPAAATRASRAFEGRLRAEKPTAEGNVWRYALLAGERDDLLSATCALLTRLMDELI